MAILNILRYPDPRLHKIAKPVTAFDERLEKLVADMAETMYEAPGIGLAASQVDVHEQVVVIDITEEKNALVAYINPEILWASDDKQVYDEGCLSVPGIYDGVERSSRSRYAPSTSRASRLKWKPTACWRSASSTKWIT
jgi:peptide deformylase